MAYKRSCASEECDGEGKYLCSKCKDIAFCSKDCQLANLHWHKKCCIDPSKTAFNLMKTVYADDFDTMNDALKSSYGFEKCKTAQDKVMLLGLYQGLIKFLDCDINAIDKAYNQNKLPELIVSEFFNNSSPKSCGEYFRWFIKDLDRCIH
jgi:hypothetical protein